MAYTTVNDPSAYFQTKIYTGDGTEDRNITNDGNTNLQPDWIWIKRRNGADRHVALDSCRGATKNLTPNNSNAEDTNNGMTAFQSNGFQVGGQDEGVSITNWNSFTYAAWQWAAGGAAPTQTYRVVVVSDGGNKYRWRNSANSATFAQSAVTLNLQEGGTYTIDGSDSTMDSHPIKLSTTSNGTHGGGSSYNTGVVYKLDGSTVTESAYVSGYATATTRQLVITVAASAPTLYYYCHYHSGMGGQINTNSLFGSTNFDGSILSVVNANTTAGFSIVSYTGTGSLATVGHGLGASPHMMIFKRTDSNPDWTVYHHKNTSEPATEFLILNGTDATTDNANNFNDTAPTSTVFTINDAGKVNASSGTYIVYCFTSIKGYSKFGGYTGNGSSNGTFVYTGFKPAWIMTKRTDSTGAWNIQDHKRSPFNVQDNFIQTDVDAEAAAGGTGIWDSYSNGFKLRQNLSSTNNNGSSYIYMAFAEQPLVATNNIVATAR